MRRASSALAPGARRRPPAVTRRLRRQPDRIVVAPRERADQPRSGRRPRRGVAEDPPAALQLAAEDRRRRCASCPTWPCDSRPPTRRPTSPQIPPGVQFHDGRELTSADVVYTFRRFLDPAFVSGRKGAYRDLAAVDVVDRYTVAFRLKPPSASFPINLVMGIVPDGHRRRGGASARRQRPVPARGVRARRPRDAHAAFDGYYGGAPTQCRPRVQGRARRDDARARAAQGQRRSRRQRPVARHRARPARTSAA